MVNVEQSVQLGSEFTLDKNPEPLDCHNDCEVIYKYAFQTSAVAGTRSNQEFQT
jgi:hypothetical protein